MASPTTGMTSEELKEHPEYPHLIWPLKAKVESKLTVGANPPRRGGPVNIYYQLHGNGPLKIVLIMGLGGLSSSWQRQTRDLAHGSNAERYEILVLDNRGIGRSDKPRCWYSTSEMAQDTLELLEHVGWTGQRQLNIVGVSMGGMIAQELGMVVPERIATLLLLSTSSHVSRNIDKPWLQNMRERATMLMPRTVDERIASTKRMLYSAEFLGEADELEYVVKPFPTNGDRFAAMEVWKNMEPGMVDRSTFILQALAANHHYKSPAQLQTLANSVGRDRIVVMHGDIDMMITHSHANVLADGLGLKTDIVPNDWLKWTRDLSTDTNDIAGCLYMWPKQAHVIPIEQRRAFNTFLENLISHGQTLNGNKR